MWKRGHTCRTIIHIGMHTVLVSMGTGTWKQDKPWNCAYVGPSLNCPSPLVRCMFPWVCFLVVPFHFQILALVVPWCCVLLLFFLFIYISKPCLCGARALCIVVFPFHFHFQILALWCPGTVLPHLLIKMNKLLMLCSLSTIEHILPHC